LFDKYRWTSLYTIDIGTKKLSSHVENSHVKRPRMTVNWGIHSRKCSISNCRYLNWQIKRPHKKRSTCSSTNSSATMLTLTHCSVKCSTYCLKLTRILDGCRMSRSSRSPKLIFRFGLLICRPFCAFRSVLSSPQSNLESINSWITITKNLVYTLRVRLNLVQFGFDNLVLCSS
jgi:hypothetical protein